MKKLQQELAICFENEWKDHFNTKDYQGSWQSISLRSATGQETDIYSNYGVENYMDTPLLAELGYIKQIIDAMAFEKEAIRLLALHPNSEIKPHRDLGCSYKDGTFRLHIPIQTNEQVCFTLDGERLFLAEGTCWYMDFGQTHSIKNEGDEPRIHLVIDGLRNAWTDELFGSNGYDLNRDKTPKYDEKTKLAMIAELERMDTDTARDLIKQLKDTQ